MSIPRKKLQPPWRSFLVSRSRRQAESGFSLIEVLCAIAVLGITVVGATRAVGLALRGTKDAERHAQAALLASSRIELLRADGFIFAGEDEGVFAAPFDGYAWSESIVESDLEGLFDITVKVNREPTGEPLYELETRLFDPPYEPLVETEETPNERGRARGDSRTGRRDPRRERLDSRRQRGYGRGGI